MKLKSSVKWAIAAAATVTTVTVSVGMIANAYTYNWDETSGGGYGIFWDGNDKTEKEYYRKCYDFEFSEENSALKQAVRFELSVDIKDFYSNKLYRTIPAQATIIFGGYDEKGGRVEIGKFVENEAFSGDLKYSFNETNKASMANGKFWMELEESSFSSVEFKSIKFYDKDDRCILYGCAQELYWDEDNFKNYGQWTFYQLDAPALEVEGIQNADGTYELNADVSVSKPTMIVKTSNEANENICVSASAKRFLNGEEITRAKSFAYNSAEGANNEHKFVSSACVVLEDNRNHTKITLYSVGAEKTVTIGKLKIEAGEPQLLGVLPTISYGDFDSPDKLLESLNNATRDPDFTAPQVEGAYVDRSVKDDTALFGRALITGADGSSKVIAKVVYDEVSGFDPASHKAQTITLKAHVEADDIEFLSDSANFRDGTVFFEEQINCSADYIDSVNISKQPKTDYEYREGLDLSGGELTITYNSNDKETVPMTDARVSASGFYGANGEFPAYNSEVKVTITYTAEDGVYNPARADGAKFSVDFTAKIKDIPALDAPVITPNGGTFSNSCEVSITAQEGASIFYTTDGTDPTADSSRYTAPFTITNDAVVKAIAVKEDCYNSKITSAVFTREISTLEAPVITPNGGTFSNSCEVSITAQEGASIFYTTDGTDPTADSSRYTAPFTITNDAVVKAIAVKEDCYNSKITSAVFTREISTLEAPVITPNGGTFSNSCEVSITTQEGASVYYTTDGTEPTADSIKYTAPFTITNSATVKAIAVKEGCYNSKITSAAFTRESSTLDAPVITPNGGTFSNSCEVSITAQEGASIFYTTDGTDPTADSSRYTAPFTLTNNATVKAIAIKEGCNNSEIASAAFTIEISTLDAPVITPNGGTFSNSCEVSITAQEGASIFYTTDGTDPTADSSRYTAPFTITNSAVVKAIAVKEGYSNSKIATAEFTKRSGGGSGSGGSGSSGGRPAASTEPDDPTIGGSSKSWSDIAADLAKLADGSEVTIQLNGNTTVPVVVIKVIDDKYLKVHFIVDSSRGWFVNGAEITAPAAADLSFIRTASQKHDSLRGIEGTQLKINNTGVPAGLEIAFRSEHAGKFANLYKSVDGKLVFVTCAKLGADGKVLLPNVTEESNYIVMLCEFSDHPGDMSNDGVLNAMDASAILKDIVGLESGANPLMADFNGDGNVNAMDASAVLKRIVGLI